MYSQIIRILIEFGLLLPFWPISNFHRPISKPHGSASFWNILLTYRLHPNRQTLILCMLCLLPNRQPFLHNITFLDTCQKMVSTHASSFGVIYLLLQNYFDPDYSFVPTFQSAFREIPRILCTRHASVQLVKTLLLPWPFATRPHRSNTMIHFLSFGPIHLFHLAHK